MKAIHVDELPYDATEEDVRSLFEPYGIVHSVIIGSDRDLGEFKCFALIEMDEQTSGRAVDEVNGRTVRGSALKVREAPGGSRRRIGQPPGHTAGSA